MRALALFYKFETLAFAIDHVPSIHFAHHIYCRFEKLSLISFGMCDIVLLVIAWRQTNYWNSEGSIYWVDINIIECIEVYH